MGMRTIRWRNGQCPRRNGQWAERIAHAGSEAVRLVPFSSLLLSAESLSEYRSSAWRLPLCQDAVRIMISWRHFVRYREESATMRRSRVLSERSVRARTVRGTREELAVFGGAIGAC